MIRLEVYGNASAMASVARLLDGSDDVERVRLAHATRPEHAVVVAVVRPRGWTGCSATCASTECRTTT